MFHVLSVLVGENTMKTHHVRKCAVEAKRDGAGGKTWTETVQTEQGQNREMRKMSEEDSVA